MAGVFTEKCKEAIASNISETVFFLQHSQESSEYQRFSLTSHQFSLCPRSSFKCFFLVLRGAFSILFVHYLGGNRTLNIAVYIWRLSLLSYGRHPLLSCFLHSWNKNSVEDHRKSYSNQTMGSRGENIFLPRRRTEFKSFEGSQSYRGYCRVSTQPFLMDNYST
jgi:hypothetical protein